MRIALRSTAALLLLLLAAGCFLDPSIKRQQVRREAFDLYTQGLDREKRGEYTQALDLYLKALEIGPRPAFYYHIGICHARLGHDGQAIEYLDKALAMDPGYQLARAERDLLVQRVNLNRESRPSTPTTTAATATFSRPAPVEIQAGPTTKTATRAVPAPPAPSEARAAAPSGIPSPEAVRNIVFPELYGPKEGSTSAAPAPAKETQNLPGFHFPPTEDDQATLAAEAGRLEQAAFYLEQELREKPDDWSLRLRLARVLARSGRISRAEAELREAARLAPDNAEVWYEWGGFYVRQENWAEADRCYRECLRITPDNIRARNNLGVVLLKMDLWEQAYEQFQILIKSHPDFASPYLNLAIIEAQYRKNIDQAVADAENYVRYHGARADEVRRWRQNLLLRKGALPGPDTP